MSRLRRCVSVGILAWAAVLHLLLPQSSFAQEQDEEEATVTVPILGMEIFRFALFKQNIEPLSNLNQVFNNPRNSIIILMGEQSVRSFRDRSLHDAVEAGASLLIASDQSSRGSGLGREFGFLLTGGHVEADPDDCYHGDRRFPYVQPFRALVKADKNSPQFMFQSLDRTGGNALATNIPTVLRLSPRSTLQRLAGYPFSARTAEQNNEFDPERSLFAAGGNVGEGRVLVLADHSVFENFMVWREDNGNRFFMQDCIEWLQGEEMRSHCLFVEDGRVRTDFELRVPDKPMNWLKYLQMGRQAVNQAGNQFLEQSQEQNLFNRLVVENFGVRSILPATLIGLTVMFLLYGFRLMLRSRVRSDPARTLIRPEMAALIPRGSALKQRFNGLVESNNIYESVRELIREFMSGMDAEPDAQGRPPKIVVVDGYEHQARLRRRIMRLWNIGFGPIPVRLPPDNWGPLSKDLQEVLLDADEGWWKFEISKD